MRSTLFSAKAEYGCIAMLELAAQRGDPNPVRLKNIADQHGIPKRFLVQILLQLKAAGLVASTREALRVGITWGRDPRSITLADIINVIDRSESPGELRVANHDGSLSPLARSIHGVWGDILSSQNRILEETTLAALLERAQTYDLSYQI